MNQPPEHQERPEDETRLIEAEWRELAMIVAISVYVALAAAEVIWRPFVVLPLVVVGTALYLRRTNLRRSRPRVLRGDEREVAREELKNLTTRQGWLFAGLVVWTGCALFDVVAAKRLGLGVVPVLAGLLLWLEYRAARITKHWGFPWSIRPKKVWPKKTVSPKNFPFWLYASVVMSVTFVIGASISAAAAEIDWVPTIPGFRGVLFGDGGDTEDEADEDVVEPGPHEDEEPTAPPTATPSPTESPDETSTPTAAPSPTAPDCGADTEATLQAEAEDPDVGLEMSDDYRHYGYGEVGCLTSAGVAQEGAISYGILVGGDSDPSMVVGTEDHGASVIFDHAYERTLRYIRNHMLRYVTDRIDAGAGDFYLYLLKGGRCALSAREYKGDPYVDLPPIVSGLVNELADERDKFPVPQGIEPSGTQLRYSIEFRGAVPSQDELETVVLEGGTASWTDAFGERHEVTEPGRCRDHLELERLANAVPPPP